MPVMIEQMEAEQLQPQPEIASTAAQAVQRSLSETRLIMQEMKRTQQRAARLEAE